MKLRGQKFSPKDSALSFGRRYPIRMQLCNVRARLRGAIAYGLTHALCACSASSPAALPIVTPVSPRAVEQVPRTVITPTRSATLEELFAEAEHSLRSGDGKRAAAQFDRIVAIEPSGQFAGRALLQAGLAFESSENWEQSALRFERLAQAPMSRPLVLEGLVRAIRMRLHLGHWERAQRGGELLLENYPNAPPLEKIVAHTGWSLGALHHGQRTQADYHVAKGLSVVERLSLDRAGRIPRDLAVLYFALGETRRVRVEAARINSDPAHFAKSLEQRCSRLLEAQSAYSDSMRAHDAHWSTLSGLRVGELYAHLHQELLEIPPPRAVQDREQHLFEGAMRERYSVLLNKALTMIEHTVAMADRTGVAPQWKARAVALELELKSALDREQLILDRLPYTRVQLREALEALAKRSQ